MIGVTTYHQTGRIHQRMVLLNEAEADMNSPEGGGWTEGHHDAETKWVDGGEIKDRPELDLPDHIVVNLSDNEVEFPAIPEETVVRYDKMEAGVADEEGITLSFDEAGKWEIYFDPPFPYQPAIIEAEVEDD